MTLSRSLLLVTLLVGLLGARPAQSAEPASDPCVLEITAEQIDKPPKRELKAERIAETYKSSIKQASPFMLEQKFFARVQFVLPKLPEQMRLERQDPLGNRIKETLPYFGDHVLVSASALAPYGRQAYPNCFAEMIALIPEDRRPPKEDLDYFTSPWLNRLLEMYTSSPTLDQPAQVRTLGLLATTAEEAEQRARSLVAILDQGYFRALQLSRFNDHQAICQQRRDLEAKLVEDKAELEKLRMETEKLVDFTPEVLVTLRSQRVQQEVELAGVKARLALSAKLLLGDLPPDRKKQVEEAKLAAEIELAGLEARQARSIELLAQGKAQCQMVARSDVLTKQNVATARNIRSLADRAAALAPQIEAFRPMPVVDNKIIIQAVEWTQ